MTIATPIFSSRPEIELQEGVVYIVPGKITGPTTGSYGLNIRDINQLEVSADTSVNLGDVILWKEKSPGVAFLSIRRNSTGQWIIVEDSTNLDNFNGNTNYHLTAPVA